MKVYVPQNKPVFWTHLWASTAFEAVDPALPSLAVPFRYDSQSFSLSFVMSRGHLPLNSLTFSSADKNADLGNILKFSTLILVFTIVLLVISREARPDGLVFAYANIQNRCPSKLRSRIWNKSYFPWSLALKLLFEVDEQKYLKWAISIWSILTPHFCRLRNPNSKTK